VMTVFGIGFDYGLPTNDMARCGVP